MLDEEVIVKGSKHSGERLLIVNVIMMVMVPALIFGGNSELARGLFIALGIVAPLNVINYKRIWIDAPRRHAVFLYAGIASLFGLVRNSADGRARSRIKRRRRKRILETRSGKSLANIVGNRLDALRNNSRIAYVVRRSLRIVDILHYRFALYYTKNILFHIAGGCRAGRSGIRLRRFEYHTEIYSAVFRRKFVRNVYGRNPMVGIRNALDGRGAGNRRVYLAEIQAFHISLFS